VRLPLPALLLRVFATLWIACGAAAAAVAEQPAVARPSLARAAEAPSDARGLVFFLAIGAPPGAAAVGTAHTFPLARIAESERVEIFLTGSRRHVASSRRFLVPPGRPFSLPDGTLRDDYVVYALERAPLGVRILEAAAQPAPELGTRVKILGVPTSGSHDQEDAYGRVVALTPTRLDVDLDVPRALAGWGGAPILGARSGQVVGILEAHAAQGHTTRAIGAPLSGVVEALARPLEGGAGRPFADYARAPQAAGSSSDTRSQPAQPGESARDRPGSLLSHDWDEEPTRVQLRVDHPADGSVAADSRCGVFVSGRAHGLRGESHRFDVVMAIDTSRSTIDPAGADVNGNGVVGRQRLGHLGSIFGTGSSDPGDSILAAEVAAAHQLLSSLDPLSTRVALVVFAGDPNTAGWGRNRSRAAHTLEPLTHQYARIQRALDDVIATEPDGSTHMAAGVDQASTELLGLRGANSRTDPKAEKIVFFFTDGQPTLPYGPDMEADNVRAVLRAANRARRGGVRIHAFAIGPHALEGPIATVEMASRTGGYFTPVRHPGDLVDLMEEVSLANIDEVVLSNDTTGEAASSFRLTPDGAWAGLVRLEPGENRIRARARATRTASARAPEPTTGRQPRLRCPLRSSRRLRRRRSPSSS
jgi:Mg-chelatase subunit ChlD